MSTNDEAGVRRNSVYWETETTDSNGDPMLGADPAWKLWGRSVTSLEGEPDADWQESTGLGNVAGHEKHRNVESHERSVAYELCRNPAGGADPLYYAAKRDIDNRLLASLSVLEVTEVAGLRANATNHAYYFGELGNTHPGTDPGASARDARFEVYARGGKPDEPEVSFDPTDSAVVEVEYGMQFAKVRSYQFDAAGGNNLVLRSTDTADTGVAVDVEEVDGTTSETVNLDGADATALVESSSTYDNYRIEVPDEFAGTIEVYTDAGSSTTTAAGTLVAYIRGSSTFDGVESDSGVPMTGAGSYEDPSTLGEAISALGTGGSFDGSPLARKVMGTTVTLGNELEDTATADSLARAIHEGNQGVSAEATIFGENEVHRKFGDHIEGREGALVLPTEQFDFVLDRTYVESGGSREEEEGQAVLQSEVGLKVLAPSDGTDLVKFV